MQRGAVREEAYETLLFPEVSAQLVVPGGPIRPYLGVGTGYTVHTNGSVVVHRSLHAALGLRLLAGDTWGMRGELRVRSPQQWGAVTADVMFGVTRRVG